MRKKIVFGLAILAVFLLVVSALLQRKLDKSDKVKESNISTYNNAYIIYGENNVIYAYCEGDYKELKCSFLDGTYENVIADIVVDGKDVIQIYLKEERIEGKLVEVNETSIDVFGYGRIPVEKEMKIYDVSAGIEMVSKDNIYVGYEKYKYIIADGKIAGIIITENVVIENIRVLIKTNEFEGYAHTQVEVSSEKGLTIINDKEVIDVGINEKYVITPEKFKSKNMSIKGKNGSKIEVSSLTRAQGIPKYEGELEVTSREDGIYIVNELPLENYLKYVVPSEMPASYELEALKSQAICARTYAYTQIRSTALRKYGANVDDSTTYQVYNNCNENERTNEAVEQTQGQIIMCGENVADANYYSTSCGYGGDETIWGGEAITTNSLINQSINKSGEVKNMSEDSVFSAYIKSENSVDYDYKYPYYRWQGSIDVVKLENRLNIGTLKAIEIVKRLENGNVYEMKFVGSDGDRKVNSQYDIRTILGGEVMNITNKSGVKVNMTLLPSGFFVIETSVSNGMVTECKIYGGGLGHGVGMSQNAANEMAKQGQKCTDIISFFYDNTNIFYIY